MTDQFINGHPVKQRVIVFGEPGVERTRTLEVIKAALAAEGIACYPGVQSVVLL